MTSGSRVEEGGATLDGKSVDGEGMSDGQTPEGLS